MAKGEMLLKLYLLAGRLLYRLKIEEVENIPAQGGCVIAFNHAAPIVDGMTIAVVLLRRPDTFTFGGRGLPMAGPLSRLAQIPVRGTAQRQQEGNLKPDPGRTRPETPVRGELPLLGAYKARGLSAGELLKALALLREGRPIALAAEGELTWDGQLQYPLAPGTAWLALRGHAPVVPLVSKGGYDIMPRWARLPKLTGRATIRAGKPFYLCDEPLKRVTDEDVAAASQRVYDEMLSLLR